MREKLNERSVDSIFEPAVLLMLAGRVLANPPGFSEVRRRGDRTASHSKYHTEQVALGIQHLLYLHLCKTEGTHDFSHYRFLNDTVVRSGWLASPLRVGWPCKDFLEARPPIDGCDLHRVWSSSRRARTSSFFISAQCRPISRRRSCLLRQPAEAVRRYKRSCSRRLIAGRLNPIICYQML